MIQTTVAGFCTGYSFVVACVVLTSNLKPKIKMDNSRGNSTSVNLTCDDVETMIKENAELITPLEESPVPSEMTLVKTLSGQIHELLSLKHVVIRKNILEYLKGERNFGDMNDELGILVKGYIGVIKHHSKIRKNCDIINEWKRKALLFDQMFPLGVNLNPPSQQQLTNPNAYLYLQGRQFRNPQPNIDNSNQVKVTGVLKRSMDSARDENNKKMKTK